MIWFSLGRDVDPVASSSQASRASMRTAASGGSMAAVGPSRQVSQR